MAAYSEAVRLDPRPCQGLQQPRAGLQAKGELGEGDRRFQLGHAIDSGAGRDLCQPGHGIRRRRPAEKAIADYGEAHPARSDRSRAQSKGVTRPIKRKPRETRLPVGGEKPGTATGSQDARGAKYDTIAHRAVKIELEVKNKDFAPNYELLDSIINEAKTKIEKKDSYTKQEATANPQDDRRHSVSAAVHFPGQHAALRRPCAAKGDAENGGGARADRPAINRTGDTVYFSNHVTTCLLYCMIGEALGLPIRGMNAPQHTMVRWPLADSSAVNWETTAGVAMTDLEVATRFGLSDLAVQRGVFLAAVSEDRDARPRVCGSGERLVRTMERAGEPGSQVD